MKFFTIIILMLCTVYFTSHSALAGIVADLTIRYYPGSKDSLIKKGKYYIQDKKVSVEYSWQAVMGKTNGKEYRQTMKEGFYLDQNTWKAIVLLSNVKKFKEVDLMKLGGWERGQWDFMMQEGAIPLDVHEFKKRGYDLRLLKEEKVLGHNCKVWQTTYDFGNRVVTTNFWVAQDLNDLPIKIVITDDDQFGGLDIEWVLTNIKEKKVKDSVFTYPAGYSLYQPNPLGPFPLFGYIQNSLLRLPTFKWEHRDIPNTLFAYIDGKKIVAKLRAKEPLIEVKKYSYQRLPRGGYLVGTNEENQPDGATGYYVYEFNESEVEEISNPVIIFDQERKLEKVSDGLYRDIESDLSWKIVKLWGGEGSELVLQTRKAGKCIRHISYGYHENNYSTLADSENDFAQALCGSRISEYDAHP